MNPYTRLRNILPEDNWQQPDTIDGIITSIECEMGFWQENPTEDEDERSIRSEMEVKFDEYLGSSLADEIRERVKPKTPTAG